MYSIKGMRLTYINHGLNESWKRFHAYLKSEDTQNSLSIVSSLSEVLLWINLSDEWHFRNNKKRYKNYKEEKLEGQYIEGLRFAFNSIKHEMSFIKLIQTTGTKEFIKGLNYVTEDYSTETTWKNVDTLIPYKSKYRKEREDYKKYIEGKKVVETVGGAINLLRELYVELKQNELKSRM